MQTNNIADIFTRRKISESNSAENQKPENNRTLIDQIRLLFIVSVSIFVEVCIVHNQRFLVSQIDLHQHLVFNHPFGS